MAKAKKEKESQTNPLTGLSPNQFTQVTNRSLPAPKNVRPVAPAPEGESERLQDMHELATAPGGVNDAQLGYGRTGGMSPESHAWLTGARRMFPNTGAAKNTPAINQPHAAQSGVTVQRRAEDLSGPEYRKGEDVLARYGHDPSDPLRSLTRTQGQALDRVVGEHAAAGVEESASQHFYGGAPITTATGDSRTDAAHKEGMSAANSRFQQSVSSFADSPQFSGDYPTRRSAALNMMAQATADTSPNSKWRTPTTGRWPNIEQAEEAVSAGLEGRAPKFVAGRAQNNDKAAGRVADMAARGKFDVEEYGNPYTAPKTVAFRGALVDPNSPDAYKVSDVHEASVVAPGLPTGKATLWQKKGDSRKTALYPDDDPSKVRGMTQIMKPGGKQGGQRPDTGNSRPEEMLATGGPYVHALNDRATREALTERGLSRGVNYSDNVHAAQAAAWGSQQVRRPDVMVSHADQYPVIRDWAAEGHADLNDLGAQVFGGRTRNLSPQFVENPNRTAINKKGDLSHDPTRAKPYPLM